MRPDAAAAWAGCCATRATCCSLAARANFHPICARQLFYLAAIGPDDALLRPNHLAAALMTSPSSGPTRLADWMALSRWNSRKVHDEEPILVVGPRWSSAAWP